MPKEGARVHRWDVTSSGWKCRRCGMKKTLKKEKFAKSRSGYKTTELFDGKQFAKTPVCTA